MTHVAEERLALYAGEDLSGHEALRVEEHLVACVQCREVVAGFRNCGAVVLRSFGEPAANELWDVRRRLLQRLEEPNYGHWRWMWAGVAALAAVVLAFGIGWQRNRTIAPNREIDTPYLATSYRPVVQVSLPNLVMPMEQARVRRRRNAAPGLRTVTLLAQRGGPPLLKMTTNDPDVVILWQLQERKERQ